MPFKNSSSSKQASAQTIGCGDVLSKYLASKKKLASMSKYTDPVVQLDPSTVTDRAFFHGSPKEDLKELREKSWVSGDRNVAHQMGRFYKETGRTWSDEDLEEPYSFDGEPKWKKGRVPDGEPSIYKLKNSPGLNLSDLLDLLDNPYEHQTKVPIAVEKDKAKAEEVPSVLSKSGSLDSAYKLVFYKNRSTPQVLRADRGEEPRPKKGYGEVVGKRDASPEEVKKIEKGDWLRVDFQGHTPKSLQYKVTEYRKQLGEKRRKALEEKENKSKTAAQTIEEEDAQTIEKPKKKKSILPWLLLGGGLGLGVAGATMFSPHTKRLISRFNNPTKTHTEFGDGKKQLSEYISRGSDTIAEGKVWGLPVTQFIKSVRSIPGLPDSLKWKEDSGVHYRAFEKGPLSAYVQYMHEAANNGRIKPRVVENLKSHLDSMARWRGFKDGFENVPREDQKWMFEQFQKPSLLERATSPLLYHTKNKADNIVGQQLVPFSGRLYDETLVNTVNAVPTILGGAGLGLGLTGAALLHKQKQKEEEEEEQKQASALRLFSPLMKSLGKAEGLLKGNTALQDALKKVTSYRFLDPKNINKNTMGGALVFGAPGSAVGAVGGAASSAMDSDPNTSVLGGVANGALVGLAGGAAGGAALGRWGLKPMQRGIGRVVTNIVHPEDYSVDKIFKNLSKKTVGDVIRAVAKDKPLYKLDKRDIGRETLYRKFFGLEGRNLHNHKEPFFVPNKTKGVDDGTLRFNPKNPVAKAEMEDIAEQRVRGISYNDLEQIHPGNGAIKGPKDTSVLYVDGYGPNKAKSTLGRFGIKPGGTYKDTWDFALHKNESIDDKSKLLRSIVSMIGTPATVKGRTLSTRQAFEKAMPKSFRALGDDYQGAVVDAIKSIKPKSSTKAIKAQLQSLSQHELSMLLQALSPVIHNPGSNEAKAVINHFFKAS